MTTPGDGPYFDDLRVGQIFGDAPSITLTDGLAAAHQAIAGDRLRLALDRHLSTAVTGVALAHPALVWDVAIGQSTIVTRRVKANLFYRGLNFHRFPALGDTLRTRTEVVGLRQNSAKPGRRPTGMAALRITCTDHLERTVLDFHRCAMLPLSENPDPARVVSDDDLSRIGIDTEPARTTPPPWDLRAFRAAVPGTHFDPALAGQIRHSSGDVVSNAPEFARLSLNIAATHHDYRVGEQGRLVYGGHAIGIALAQATRALPNLVTVLGWHSCDHTGPVHEGDTLSSELTVDSATALDDDGGVLQLRSRVFAHNTATTDRQVLDWRFTALLA
ncbi:Beta-methylmalyl-CoA dehydratase [Nocardia cerradoensis]|uniref:Beta-methylmalyl-CoA dehydratase n=1 Tax=Nocardia cerradoensis TaxID=85688 RepID=A0A231H372_9NOCA|nr:MaoC family dehydratase [Nocardia cerradoensis]OXR43252.1 Beta-methylmalyl-CoA dehydratase [Nocardia cerradoensis]